MIRSKAFPSLAISPSSPSALAGNMPGKATVFRVRVHRQSKIIREQPIPVDTLRTDSSFTTYCSTEKGCDSAFFDSWGSYWSFHGCALPFYSASGNSMDHFLPRAGLRKEVRRGREIYTFNNVLPLQEVHFGSGIGLLAYFAFVSQDGGESRDRITLLESDGVKMIHTFLDPKRHFRDLARASGRRWARIVG